MDQSAVQKKIDEEKEKTPMLRSLDLPIVWPKKTDVNGNYTILTDDKALLLGHYGKTPFLSDIFLSVPSTGNIYTDSDVRREDGNDLHLAGDILMLVENNGEYNHSLIKARDVLEIGDLLVFTNDRMNFRLNKKTGDYDVFYNAGEIDGKSADDSAIIKYIAFLTTKASATQIEDGVDTIIGNLTRDATAITSRIVKGWATFSETEQKLLIDTFTKVIYSNKKAKLKTITSLYDSLDAADATPETEAKKIEIKAAEAGKLTEDEIIAVLSPEFADEPIDWSTIEVDDKGFPVINENDVKNLGYIGFKGDQVKMIVNASMSSIDMSKEVLEASTKFITDNKAAYDSAIQTLSTADLADLTATRDLFFKEMAIVSEYIENERNIESCNAHIQDQKDQLAGFQVISRIRVKKGIDNGDFTAAHAFNAFVVFNKTMRKHNLIDDKNFFGSYVSLLKYTIMKAKDIGKDPNYFGGLFFNYITGRTNTNRNALHVSDVAENVIRALVRTEDIRNLDDSMAPEDRQRAMDMLMKRIQGRVDFLFMIGNYPVSTTGRFFQTLVTELDFSDTEEGKAQILENWKNVNKTYLDQGWVGKDTEAIEKIRSKLVDQISTIREIVLDPESFEKLHGFIKYCKEISLNEYAKALGTAKPKNIAKILPLLLEYDLLMEACKYADAFVSCKVLTADKDGNEKQEDITKSNALALLLRYFVETAGFILAATAGNRLLGEMVESAGEIHAIPAKDAATFFSVMYDGIVVPIEIMEKAQDTPDKVENLDSFITDTKIKMFGKEATKTMFSGLQGFVDEETKQVSRLGEARSQSILLSHEYTSIVLGMVIDFLKLVTKYED